MFVVNLINDKIKTPIHDRKEKLKSGSVVQGINCIDSFSFTILPSNRGFNSIFDFTTLVEVYNENKKRYEFQGRVLCSNPDMAENGLISKTVTCESFFGYLCDSQQPYVEEKNWTVKGFLTYVIGEHNKQVESYKHFTIGEITVTDPNDNLYMGVQRENTWKTIEEKLIGKLGGEIRFRVVDEVIYIDYLEKIGVTRATAIELSKNMKSITKEIDPSEYITRLIPLGCKLSKEEISIDDEGNETKQTVETEERLDISKVNNGKNYIDFAAGIEAYGIHVGYVIYDDVTDETNLLSKGRKWFEDNSRVQVKYSVKALDLSLIGLDIDDFEVHNYHPIINPLLGIDDTARIIKKTIDVCEVVQSSFEIGDNFKTLTEVQLEQKKEFESLSDAIQRLQSTSNNIKSYVSTVKTGLTNRIDGINGIFFYIRYSEYEDGHVMTDAPNEKTLYIGTCSTNVETAPVDFREYTWALIKGSDGIDGEPGEDGKTQYLHIKYSNDGSTFTDNNGETVGDWIGTCVDYTEADPTEFSAYKWKKFKGESGTGVLKTEVYYYLSSSNITQTGGSWVTTPPQWTEGKYYWQKIITTFTDGQTSESTPVCVTGEKGSSGKSIVSITTEFYLSTSKTTQTGGSWVTTMPVWSSGLYLWTRNKIVYENPASTEYTTPICDSSWEAVNDLDSAVNERIDGVNEVIIEETTKATNTSKEIIFEALKSYTEKNDYEGFKETVEAQLKILADQISLNFTKTLEELNTVNGDLQSQLNTITAHFLFEFDGFTIGRSDSPYKIVISHNRQTTYANDVEVQVIDAVTGEVLTPKLTVTERFNLFGFVIEQDASGNVNCDFVGNYTTTDKEDDADAEEGGEN